MKRIAGMAFLLVTVLFLGVCFERKTDFSTLVCESGVKSVCCDGPEGTRDVGCFRTGLRGCLEEGGLSDETCFGQIMPAEEICDNVDNDCDGLTDVEVVLDDEERGVQVGRKLCTTFELSGTVCSEVIECILTCCSIEGCEQGIGICAAACVSVAEPAGSEDFIVFLSECVQQKCYPRVLPECFVDWMDFCAEEVPSCMEVE